MAAASSTDDIDTLARRLSNPFPTTFSSPSTLPHRPHRPPHHQHHQHHHHHHHSPHPYPPPLPAYSVHDPTALAEALHLLRTHPSLTISYHPPSTAAPRLATADFANYPLPVAAPRPRPVDWSSQHQHTSMGAPAAVHLPVSFRSRTASASTITTGGPVSPQAPTNTYPHVVNTEFAPHSPLYFADNSAQSGSLDAPTYLAPPSAAHQAMQVFAIDHHNVGDFAPDFTHSARQSMSSHNGSPATPMSGYCAENMDAKQSNLAQNDFSRQTNPNVQLFRTESQAYQDELYNPPTTSYSSAPNTTTASRPANDYLSPHRKLISEALQTANNARAQSPSSAMPRERSPFRDGSPLAFAGSWASSAGMTAANLRRQQKEQAAQAEYAQHRPRLQREPTKTISPKEAMLDYNEPEQTSLFQDSIPAGYQRHNGGIEQWQNGFGNHPGSMFNTMQSAGQPVNFRSTPADGFSGPEAFNFVSLPQELDQSQVANNYQQSLNPPPFPTTLTSMDSSISDNAPQSSQDNPPAVKRPADTRANTGTYTCTYHSCTHRFHSQPELQKHKREVHRSQLHRREESNASSSGAVSSMSAHSSASPSSEEDEDGLTSAAIMARNSQAGPHKCTRINPSTGKPCDTIFSRPYDLTRHEDTIHNGRKQKVRCPLCREEKTFSRNDALTRHMRVVHPEVDSFGKRGRRD
ncbi:Hypothetical protein R9X50_00325300 [Acrodontium crateriforme]|uniref:C2H2-type domain-containing protein n=1 Tax=Acrodontium crateriforme TaxID=150365 RepID=A0AAQ3M3Z8_9PEZI|nr:Hypothetical protein R9X50_00325300 [Acrodontium crateriforme]